MLPCTVSSIKSRHTESMTHDGPSENEKGDTVSVSASCLIHRTVSLISSRVYHTVYGKGGRGDDGDASLQRPVPIDTSRVALLHFVLRAH